MYYRPANAIQLISHMIKVVSENLNQVNLPWVKGWPTKETTTSHGIVLHEVHVLLAKWVGWPSERFALSLMFELDSGKERVVGIEYHATGEECNIHRLRLPIELCNVLSYFRAMESHPGGITPVYYKSIVSNLASLAENVSAPFKTIHGVLETDLSRYWHDGREIYPSPAQAALFVELLNAKEAGIESNLAKRLVAPNISVSDAYNTKHGEVLWKWIVLRNKRYFVCLPVAVYPTINGDDLVRKLPKLQK